MNFLSVCSGIEAASVAWKPLGWEAIGFSEIEPFPCAVLKHHYPDVPNFGDMTNYHAWPNTLRPDLIAGGTPCQAFSVAGLRQGLADPRGNLALVFLGIVDRFRPRWVVWENVPGVHSSWSDEAAHPASEESLRKIREAVRAVGDAGIDLGTDFDPDEFEECDQTNDFDSFLAGLAQLGYGTSYRILDAQFTGVPQRRRRVFVVGYLGDWRRAAAVLSDRESLLGNPPPRRQPGQAVAGTLTKSALDGSSPCGGDGREGLLISETAPTLSASAKGGGGLGTDFDLDGGLVAGTVATLDASYGRLHGCSPQDLKHGHSHLIAFGGNNTSGPIDLSPALNANRGCHNPGDFEAGALLTEVSLPGVCPVCCGVAIEEGKASPGHPCGCDSFPAPPSVSPPLTSNPYGDHESREGLLIPEVTHALTANGHDASEDGTGRGTPLVPVAFNTTHTTHITSVANRANPLPGDPCHTLAAGDHPPAIAFSCKDHGADAGEVSPTLRSMGHDGSHANGGGQVAVAFAIQEAALRENPASGPQSKGYQENVAYTLEARDAVSKQQCVAVPDMAVRRLTPRECERLQGFPDDYTQIPGWNGWRDVDESESLEELQDLGLTVRITKTGKARVNDPDGPRYKALGNSWAVPCARWIGQRIALVDSLYPPEP